ncbi:MAG: MBL fold metallo-hydrolase [Lachnospiraceae bacterium]|nr:MBL fold metallo-hydrolase [Lachnospiraceae bacterium]
MTDQIVKLYDNTWAIQDMGVRIFILAGTEKVLVVDTGMSALPVHDIVRQVSDLPVMLLNTHADPDHIAGNDAFGEFFMHPSEAVVYHNIHHRKGKMLPVFDGDEIDLGGRIIRVIHVPGHTPGSITVLDVHSRCLIGGDPIQEDGDIFMFGLHRDMEAYIAGLQRLWTRESEFDYIYPSHAKIKVEKSIIPKLISGAQGILAGKFSGVEKEVHGNRILSVNVGVSCFLCGLL